MVTQTLDIAFRLSIKIVELKTYLVSKHNEHFFSERMLNSGYSLYPTHEKLKETKFWIKILYTTEYIDNQQYKSLTGDCDLLMKMI